MAMTMTGEATLPAPRPKVWALLNDQDVLKDCIPGCQSLERAGDTGFAAVAKVKIGPVSATFKGKVELSDIVPDVGYPGTTGPEESGSPVEAKEGNAFMFATDLVSVRMEVNRLLGEQENMRLSQQQKALGDSLAHGSQATSQRLQAGEFVVNARSNT